MEEKTSADKRLALLIDADNVSAKYLKPILDELSKYGTVTYKRIYGDWTLTLHAKWKDALLENSITPIQQFGYTQGKNATDSAMIIDAMDILYTNSVEGFCIVSSDSDFTRLASRLRESGLTVIGMGEKKTPVPFRKACDIFTTLELLLPNAHAKSNRNRARATVAEPVSSEGGPSIDDVEQAVIAIVTDNQNTGKATGLGEVGSRLQKRFPDFDVRSYGTNLLSKLIEDFEGVSLFKERNNITVVLTEVGELRAKDYAEQAGYVAETQAEPGEAASSPGAPENAQTSQTPQTTLVPNADASEPAQSLRQTGKAGAKAEGAAQVPSSRAALPEPTQGFGAVSSAFSTASQGDNDISHAQLPEESSYPETGEDKSVWNKVSEAASSAAAQPDASRRTAKQGVATKAPSPQSRRTPRKRKAVVTATDTAVESLPQTQLSVPEPAPSPEPQAASEGIPKQAQPGVSTSEAALAEGPKGTSSAQENLEASSEDTLKNMSALSETSGASQSQTEQADASEESAQPLPAKKPTRRGKRGGVKHRKAAQKSAEAQQAPGIQQAQDEPEPSKAQEAPEAARTREEASTSAAAQTKPSASSDNERPADAPAEAVESKQDEKRATEQPVKPAPQQARKRGAKTSPKKSDAQASAQTAEVHETGEPAETKPAKRAKETTTDNRPGRGTRKKREQATSPQAPMAQVIESALRAIVRDAGKQGISATEAARRLRAKYKDFRVHDLGYGRLHSYAASLSGIEAVKEGKDYILKTS